MSNGMRSLCCTRRIPAAGDATCRSGKHAARRKSYSLGYGGNTSMRLNDENRACEAGFAEPGCQARQIAVQHRTYIRVHDCGADAVVFLDLRQNLRGAAHVSFRHGGTDCFHGRALM